MSSQPSSPQPMSPSKRGSPLLTSAANTCCFVPAVRLCGLATLPVGFSSVPRAKVGSVGNPDVAFSTKVEDPGHALRISRGDELGGEWRTHDLLDGESR